MNLQAILTKYWGFSSFRPLQEDIIQSVLEGRDALALLPTGGGKSICYQVPGLAAEGICIVVSPLIALMKDQVQSLRDKGIKAVGIYHGMSRMEIDNAVDNCVYGDVKFLYLSPERLTTEIIRSRLEKMKVNLLAIDEAHCISQWGYDFRPPYLRIAEIRDLLPETPVLALTATATRQVVADIMEKLHFSKTNVFQKSFERKNLAYLVFREEDKLQRLLKICRNVQGTGLVYVRNRKKTREIAEWLKMNGVSADYYHAGLTSLERDAKQNAWMKERTRVIVSTNAFGMGIDKPNVRFVVHMSLPDSPEAYFQEAGRAGRDGYKAYAVLLYNPADLAELESFHKRSYPPLATIKAIYNSLGNYFQLAMGSGKDQSMPFDLLGFSRQYGYDPFLVFNALGFLEREGYIATSEALANPSRIMFTIDNEDLYRFQVANPKYNAFTKLLLRSYTGLFSEFGKISEKDMASRAGIPEAAVIKLLQEMHNMQILHYQRQNTAPLITFLEERMPASAMLISKEVYREREAFSRIRMQAMIQYTSDENACRSGYLLSYFGEEAGQRCGQCDICLERNKAGVSDHEYDQITQLIKGHIQQSPTTLESLLDSLDTTIPEEKITGVVRYLTDNHHISIDETGKMHWK